ncbi:MAG: DUF4856 domain-containing protein, partial [Bacteroidota bacterium]
MNTSTHKTYTFWLFMAVMVFMTACEQDPVTPDYTIPTTYNFENVSYSGQTQRIGQLAEMKTYMATSREMGTALSADRLKGMFANDAANAQWNGTYEESKQLRSKTLESVQAAFDDLLVELAAASESTVEGSEGVAGVIESLNGEKKYLIGEDGLDHAQVIEKGLMGATFYYQGTAVYFGEDRMSADNEIITPGEGTDLEHHWDEAFGYFGVPIDFPTNTTGLAFWGNYANLRNAILGSNQKSMDAFLKGRAAISNDDLTTRDEAIMEASEAWEEVSVGSALHYLNVGIDNFDDMAIMAHGVSEGIGFIYSLQFNPRKRITNEQVNELLTLIAGSANFADMNLYTATKENFQEAKDKLAGYYDLEDVKDDFKMTYIQSDVKTPQRPFWSLGCLLFLAF